MISRIRKVPKEVSRDQIIYFDDEQGWVYQHPDQALIHSIYNAIEENSAEDIDIDIHLNKEYACKNQVI